MSSKNEPECWTCVYIGGKPPSVVCQKHEISVPSHAGGAYYICRDFEHYLSSDIGVEFAGGKKEDMKEQVLYTYRFMEPPPPREYMPFAKLKVQASKVKS